MDERPSDPEVHEALIALQQYLSDIIAPLMVSDSIEVLMRCPPDVAASHIQAWIHGQSRVGRSASSSDYVFHALKKIHLVGQYRLVPAEPLFRFVQTLANLLLQSCPPEERETLLANLARLGSQEVPLDGPVEILYRPEGRVAAASREVETGAALPQEILRDHRRLTLMLDRLERERSAAAPASDRGPELLAELVSAAAGSSRSGEELRGRLDQMRERGLEARLDEVFRQLGRSLPSWVAPVSAPGAGTVPPMPAPAETMRRLVTMEEDAAESGRRLHEMVRAAIEQFNEGSLAKAVTIFSVAEKILAEKRVDPGVAKSIRETAHEGFDPNRLREFAEKEEAHPLLRQVLAFFPALSPDGLLADLQTEEKRERRRLLLALVEAHGAAGRAAVAALLESAIADAATDEGYFLRNIVYLLRRIPKPAEVPAEPEIERVASLSHPGLPAFLLKEAIAYLAQTKHEKAEQALIARLQDVEAMLLDPDEAIYDRKELHSLLDRIVTALARFGTREPARAVVTHGLKRQPQLGESFLRLADLGGQDFSTDKETLGRLTSAIRDEMPRRVLGFTLQKNRPRLLSLVQAVAGTSDPSVRELLREVADRFPGEEAGHAAAKVLSAPAAPHGPAAAAAPGASSAHTAPAHASAGAPAPASLAGDLELFGLPNLLQNLAQSELTGSLTIVDRAGETAGTLWLAGGRMQKARVGLLEGDEAVYQLFEKPMPGTFSFVSPSVGGSSEKKPQGRDLMPLLLEGMRRYDEFQRARALVPDDASFGPAAKKPTRPSEERDPSLLRAIWTKASSGSTPTDCEAEIPTDAYRIRRLFAHWLEEGALEPK